MKYTFNCYGHENITAKHKTTLEFTKEKGVSLKGDCIVGVRADFDLLQLKRFIKSVGNNKKITIVIQTIGGEYNNKNSNKNETNNSPRISNNKNAINNEKNIKNNDYNKIIEKINAEINPNFSSGKEMVIRKTDFISERTFAIKADKAAFELNRDLIKFLRQKKSEIMVIFENKV